MGVNVLRNKKLKEISLSPQYSQQLEVVSFTQRLNHKYDGYLMDIKQKTGISKSQLIRLLIHLAPNNKEFNEIIKQYELPHASRFIYMVDWQEQSDLWKWDGK